MNDLHQRTEKGEKIVNLWNDGLKKLEGIHCMANYQEQILTENKGNPFIEAIPNRISVDDFYDKLYTVPKYESKHTNLGMEDRLELVRQIRPSFGCRHQINMKNIEDYTT
jgi:hypothetical protein